jgi:hypothetical protein
MPPTSTTSSTLASALSQIPIPIPEFVCQRLTSEAVPTSEDILFDLEAQSQSSSSSSSSHVSPANSGRRPRRPEQSTIINSSKSTDTLCQAFDTDGEDEEDRNERPQNGNGVARTAIGSSEIVMIPMEEVGLMNKSGNEEGGQQGLMVLKNKGKGKEVVVLDRDGTEHDEDNDTHAEEDDEEEDGYEMREMRDEENGMLLKKKGMKVGASDSQLKPKGATGGGDTLEYLNGLRGVS